MPSHADPINRFEIPVTDLGRARTFCETFLGVAIAHFLDAEGNQVALHESP